MRSGDKGRGKDGEELGNFEPGSGVEHLLPRHLCPRQLPAEERGRGSAPGPGRAGGGADGGARRAAHGFQFGGRQRRNEAELDAFLDNPVVQVLPVDSETSSQYAEIIAELHKAGTPIPDNDIWIAATAARNGTTVLTCDDHVERIARVGSVVIAA